MLEAVDTLGLVGEPRVEFRHDAVHRVPAALVEVPVPCIMCPHDGLEAEYPLGDGSDAIVDVAIWRTPEARDAATIEVGHDLERPAELADNLLVGQGSHY